MSKNQEKLESDKSQEKMGLKENSFGAVINFFFWTKIYEIQDKCLIKIVILLQLS